MSSRQDKKQRQFMRRQFREEYQEEARAIAERDRKFLKPRPWWVPSRLWIWGLRIFVRIK